MSESTTRRGFLARAAAPLFAVPFTSAITRRFPRSAAQRALTLQFFRGADMEHEENLATDTDVTKLGALAEQHAGGPLTWAGGETEDAVAFAMHPAGMGEYLIVDAATVNLEPAVVQ